MRGQHLLTQSMTTREHIQNAMTHLKLARKAEQDHDQPLLDVLQELRMARMNIDHATDGTVILARSYGSTWANIGIALGLTKQGAEQRFSEVIAIDDDLRGVGMDQAHFTDKRTPLGNRRTSAPYPGGEASK